MKNAPHFGNFVYGYEANSNLIKTIHSYSNYNFNTNTGTGIHTVTNTYEPNRDVLLTKHNQRASDNATISSVTYNVNKIGQRTNRTTTDAANATSTAQWGYNATGEKPRRLVGVLDRREAPCLEEVSSREAAANQLTKADHSDTAQNRAYNYDGIGNRLTSSAGVSPASSTTYTPNALNQYTAISGGAFQAPSPDYDDDGNATAYPLPVNPATNATLVWDGENRLIEVVTGSTTVVYRYDAQSRRIAKSVGSASNTFFIYDYWNCIGEYTGANHFKSYTWGMDLSGSMQGAGGVGGLLAVHDGSASYYPTYDGNGNISEYLDSTGAVAVHYEYDAFGNTTVASLKTENLTLETFSHRFSTKPLDAETGLYYYGYRWYAPLTGRWPSRDPIEENGGLNLYGFVSNRSLNLVEIFGLRAMTAEESSFVAKLEALKARATADKEFVKALESVISDYKTRIDSIPANSADPLRIRYINNAFRIWASERAPQYHPDGNLDSEFAKGKDKCNAYVSHVLEGSPKITVLDTKFKEGVKTYLTNDFNSYLTRAPIAGEWANPQLLKEWTPKYRIAKCQLCGGKEGLVESVSIDRFANVTFEPPVIGDVVAFYAPTNVGSHGHVGIYLGGTPEIPFYISATKSEEFGQKGVVIKFGPEIAEKLYRTPCNGHE